MFKNGRLVVNDDDKQRFRRRQPLTMHASAIQTEDELDTVRQQCASAAPSRPGTLSGRTGCNSPKQAMLEALESYQVSA
ncbi:hypothetical protein [Methylomonas methanica]|uniref:hypothetical protein n=1 Tax=Methylomonas methanica TaxID=421 RepID=UPI0013053D1E|nr:hypothetical protein [Methylomonas methanica]